MTDTGKDVLRVLTDYAYALTTLDRYEQGPVPTVNPEEPINYLATLKEGMGEGAQGGEESSEMADLDRNRWTTCRAENIWSFRRHHKRIDYFVLCLRKASARMTTQSFFSSPLIDLNELSSFSS